MRAHNFERKPPSVITVYTDTAEVQPIVFPTHVIWYYGKDLMPRVVRVINKKKSLRKYGCDYTCRMGAQDGRFPIGRIRVERKKNLLELAKNLLSGDRERQFKSFTKMQAGEFRYLLLEASVPEMLAYRGVTPLVARTTLPDPKAVLDAIFAACNRFGMILLPCPRPGNPVLQGEFLVHLFLSLATWERPPAPAETQALVAKNRFKHNVSRQK